MPVDEIHQIFPHSSESALDDDALLALYGSEGAFVRANFVASVDGASTVKGLSGSLGGPADKRVFDLLRQLSDVIVVGAGTLRTEKYDAMRLSEDASRWRIDHGLSPQPPLAIVSARLDLDPASDVFAGAPVRPIVLTAEMADPNRREQLARVADVISCGEKDAGGRQVVEALNAIGLTRVHCEGGPHLLGTLIADDVLDELCLTTSPLLEGGVSPRIDSTSSNPSNLAMALDHILMAGSMLLSKYSRIR